MLVWQAFYRLLLWHGQLLQVWLLQQGQVPAALGPYCAEAVQCLAPAGCNVLHLPQKASCCVLAQYL